LKFVSFKIVEFVIFISITVMSVTFNYNIDAFVVFVVLSTARIGWVTLLGNVMLDVLLST